MPDVTDAKVAGLFTRFHVVPAPRDQLAYELSSLMRLLIIMAYHKLGVGFKAWLRRACVVPSNVELTGLRGEASLAGPNLVRVVFQLSAIPAPGWAVIFMDLARELAREQNHGVRPGFRFSYRLDADTIQVSCPVASFTIADNGKNRVAQAVIDLVANVNCLASKQAPRADNHPMD